MARCDYWWFAGGVEWCDMTGSNCRCGGGEESCLMKPRKKKQSRVDMLQMESEPDERRRYAKHNHTNH